MLPRLIRLIAAPLILVAGLGAYGAIYRLSGISAKSQPLSFARRQPWNIEPRYQRPRVVTDEQLFSVLDRLKPPRGSTNTNSLLHALRLWGPRAEFDNEAYLSGEEIRQYFLDDRMFRKLARDETPALYIFDPNTGDVYVRDWSRHNAHNTTSSYHLNDILATFGETGTSLDTALITRNGATNVESLLATAMRNLHLEQHEYEWSVITYARYVYPDSGWCNAYGDRILVHDLVQELIEAPLHYGPCNGLHRLEAMVVLCRVDETVEPSERTLKPSTRKKMLGHMGGIIPILEASQNVSDGFWTPNWPQGEAAQEDQSASLSQRVLVTGHHMEWLALIPPETQPQPSQQMVTKAGQWLARTIQEVDEETLRSQYTAFSHAARALCLWRSKDPYDAWREGKERAADDGE